MRNTYPIEVWKITFENFDLVTKVQIDSFAEQLHITINGYKEVLSVTLDDLDDTLHKYSGNPCEVSRNFLREYGLLDYYSNTLVGFFDIMGYSAFLSKNNFEECIQKISEFLNNTGNFAKTNFAGVKINHWILSDSIIIVLNTLNNPVSSGPLELFLAICSSIMSDSMRLGFPLRGAIGGGHFYKDGEVMVSTALTDANEYEKKQEWLGAVLTPKALQIIEKAKELEIAVTGETKIDLSSDKYNGYVQEGEIPWKEDLIDKEELPKETYYIKPLQMSEKDWEKHIPEYFDTKSDKVKKKIKNSHILYGQK